ncbi:MAG: aspartate/glutamate racemase family protein [Microvirga sp.]|nr:aspartate/glutamate racemase family protein [Microvirga sp.]
MIGVFDSGSGGLTVLAALRRALPERRFMYLGDHARHPYGPRPPAEVVSFTRDCARTLFAQGCDIVVFACNTASVLALRELQETWLPARHPDRRLLGIFVPVVETLTGRAWRRDDDIADPAPDFEVGVFATTGTVQAGHFRREIERLLPNVRVRQQACPGLAEAIEAGADPEDTARIVRGHVEAMRERLGRLPTRVILACTHYPLVRDAFAEALPGDATLIEQADIVARSLQNYLIRHDRARSTTAGPQASFQTTGDPEAVARVVARLDANRALGCDAPWSRAPFLTPEPA